MTQAWKEFHAARQVSDSRTRETAATVELKEVHPRAKLSGPRVVSRCPSVFNGLNEYSFTNNDFHLLENLMSRVPILTLCGLCLSIVAASVHAFDDKAPASSLHGLPLLHSEDFESGEAGNWEPTDDSAWRVIEVDGNHVYNQYKKRSDYDPPVRSPYNRSLVKEINVGSMVLDVQLQSTHKDYGHRDLCLFFGYQDNAHLYYVHLGKKEDPHANNIFIVDGKPRLKISTKTTSGTNWDDEWHHARVVRDVESGSIEVYFDDMDDPVMTAVDKTFTWGRVGVGSFDDTGNFDDVLIYGERVEPGE